MEKKYVYEEKTKLFDEINNSDKKILINYLKYREITNKKAHSTVDTDRRILCHLSNYLNNKNIKIINITNNKKHTNLFKNYFSNPEYVKGSPELIISHITTFFKWKLNLRKKDIIEFLYWYEYPTNRQKERTRDPHKLKKELFTTEEYNKLISVTLDQQIKAMFETMYLSGCRPSELISMNINCFEELNNKEIKTTNGKENISGYQITVLESKTKPRPIPLPNIPEELIKWIDQHPFKYKDKKPLWIDPHTLERISYQTIKDRLRKYCKFAELIYGQHKGKIPYSFRFTRATIMFREYDDSEMAKLFGWDTEHVAKLRKIYDLSKFEDLQKKVFINTELLPSRDYYKKENEKLVKEKIKIYNDFKKSEKDYKEQNKNINDLREDNIELLETLSDFMNAHIFVIEKKDLLLTKFKTSRDQRPETFLKIGIDEYHKYKKTNKKPIKNVKDFKKLTNEYTQKNITSILRDPQFNKTVYR